MCNSVRYYVLVSAQVTPAGQSYTVSAPGGVESWEESLIHYILPALLLSGKRKDGAVISVTPCVAAKNSDVKYGPTVEATVAKKHQACMYTCKWTFQIGRKLGKSKL